MHEFHPDDQYAIVTENLTEALVQGVSLTANPDGSFDLQINVPVLGTNRFMEFAAKLEPWLAGTMRTIAYAGAHQVDIELMFKGVLRRQDDGKTLYTTRITGEAGV